MHLNFINTSLKKTRSSNIGLKTKVTGIWAAHYLKKKTCVISYPSDDSTTGVLYRPTKSLEKKSMEIGSIPETADASNLPLFLECYTPPEFLQVVFNRR